MRGTTPRAWSRTRRLGVALTALLGLGVAAEILLRVATGTGPAERGASAIMEQIEAQSALAGMAYAPDAELGALPAPSLSATIETLDFVYTVETDHAGFPNPEPWPSRVDVVALGNSLLVGPGVGRDGQFTTLLQHRLGGRTVLNLGLPGAGTEHQYLAYRRYALALRPELVIGVVGVAWDIDNALHFERWRAERPETDFTQYRKTYGVAHPTRWALVKAQLARSQLVFAGYQGVKSWFDGIPILEQMTFANGDVIFLSAREQRDLGRGLDRPGAPDLRQIFFGPLERLATEVKSRDGRFVVALLPSKEELYGAEAFPAVLRAGQEVRAELEARRLPVLDLYPAFRALGPDKSPFYRADIHLNAFGNEIVADAIAGWIAEQGVFTEPAGVVSAGD
jgi:hypothetical protein